jgi:CarD family transcriptional regulator
MRFKVGDSVVHPSHGVGRIVGLEVQTFMADHGQLFYEVSTSKSTVWVPVDAGADGGLRRLSSKQELAHCRRLLQKSPVVLEPDHRKRQLELAARLRGGSFQTLCEVVRDLTARGRIKPLNESDSSALRRARSALLQEWAASAGVTLAEATAEVDGLLQAPTTEH